MSQMTDPTNALTSFQKVFRQGNIELQKGDLNPSIAVHLDRPNGSNRFTYVSTEGRVVTALAILVQIEPYKGRACFQLGYAVPEPFRGKGLAKSIVRDAIAELYSGLSRNGISNFYVEAVVGRDNLASQKVAAETLAVAPADVIDEVSGEPALHYLRKVDGTYSTKRS